LNSVIRDSVPMIDQRRQVAIAILHQDNTFLLQLRDNIPGIVYPGYWGLFGGHLEPGEQTEEAIQRELLEEIGYTPPGLTKFGCYADAEVVRYVYQAELRLSLDQLILGEGWDMGWLNPDDIRRGECYSHQANQIRPLGKPHQRILLDFINCSTQTWSDLSEWPL